MLGWTPGTFDAHNMLVNIVTLKEKDSGIFNSGRYTNPKVEELTKKAETEMDLKKRNELMVEAQKIHKDDYGHIPLHQQTLAWGVRDTVDGSVKPRPSNDVDLRQNKMM
jgi:peptide/nickel transport system substrate-binding protein